MPRIVYERYDHPGKFSDNIEEGLYEMTMESWQSAEFGSVDDIGWHGLLDFTGDLLEIEEDGEITKYQAAIVVEDSQGFFHVNLFEKLTEAEAEWDPMESEYYEMYEEEED